MSAWEEIGSTYAEAATQALPLHRILVFTAGFLISLALQQQTHFSALETLAVVRLSDFATFEKGFLAKATIANVLWAVLATCGGVVLSKTLIRFAYFVVDRGTGFSEKAAKQDRTWCSELSIEDRKVALELVDSMRIEPKSRLRTLTGTNELLVGLGSVFCVASVWGNALDCAVGLAAFACAVCSHLFAIRVFLTDYYGAALTRAHLQGKPVPHLATPH